MTIVNTIMNVNNTMTDETIVTDLISGSKAAATAYLNATLEAPTPELKAIYTSSLNAVLQSHASATALAVDHRWQNPYERPEQQLADAYKKSVSTIQYNK